MKKIILIFILFITSINAENNGFTIENCENEIGFKVEKNDLLKIYEIKEKNNKNCNDVFLSFFSEKKKNNLKSITNKELDILRRNKITFPIEDSYFKFEEGSKDTIKPFVFVNDIDKDIKKILDEKIFLKHKNKIVKHYFYSDNLDKFKNSIAFNYNSLRKGSIEKEINENYLNKFPVQFINFNLPNNVNQKIKINAINLKSKNNFYIDYMENKRVGNLVYAGSASRFMFHQEKENISGEIMYTKNKIQNYFFEFDMNSKFGLLYYYKN